MDYFKDKSLRLLLDHLRINSSTDIGSMIVSEAGLGHVEKLKNLLKAHPEKVRGFSSTIQWLKQGGQVARAQDLESGNPNSSQALSTSWICSTYVVLGSACT